MISYTPPGSYNDKFALPVSVGGGDAGRVVHNQEKTHLENRIRIMKNEVLEKQRMLHDIERDIRALNVTMKHIEEETSRIGEEYRRLSIELRAVDTESKKAEAGLREKGQELIRKQDEQYKYEQEIHHFKEQIAEKEREIMLVKQDVAKLMKEKEDLRRVNEMGYFTTKNEGDHAHEKTVRLQLLAQDKGHKEDEIVRKEQMLSEVKRSISTKEQDIMQLEEQLRRISSGG